MKSYYDILGVDRNATADVIKRAYRQKASLFHPDKEGGSKVRFQEVEEAYRTLSDPNKRAQYDNPQPQFQGFGGFHENTNFDFESIFNMFGARFGPGGRPGFQQRQARMSLWITLKDSAQGGPRTISVGTQQGTMAVEIEIPQGINDGDAVQYSGIGPGGSDLIITYRIHPNPKFQRHGNNLVMEQIVNLWDLILGCEINIRDILDNQISLTVPARCQPGTVLRLKGRGMPNRHTPTGDLLVRIHATIPDEIPADLLALIEQNRTR
jgi:curved DNA-binding protein